MNILYILDFFPEETNASDQIAGGVESRYFHLVKELRAKGHTVVVLARAHSLKEVAASSKVSIGTSLTALFSFKLEQ